MVGVAALFVAFVSATQDIVVDAFRVQSLPTDEQAAGVASYVAAYRVGMLASGAGVIGLAGWLEVNGLSKETTWPLAYALAAVLVLVGLAATLLTREQPKERRRARSARERWCAVASLRDRERFLCRVPQPRRGHRHSRLAWSSSSSATR